MSILVNWLISDQVLLPLNMFVRIVFLLWGGVIFFYLLKESVSTFCDTTNWSNRYALVLLIITIIFGVAYCTFFSACCTFFSTSRHLDIQKTIYKSVAQIEACPFDTLHNGYELINGNQITVCEDIVYPEDKVISFNQYSCYRYEVENHNGKSIVVAIFQDGKEIDFP